jgi:predicted DNA binding CopG/RHH family protein
MTDKEEKLIAEAYEGGALKLEEPSTALLRKLAGAAENTFKKDKRINIRLSNHDLEGIQRKAAKKGIPYQAMISGLIHQYVEGDLQER